MLRPPSDSFWIPVDRTAPCRNVKSRRRARQQNGGRRRPDEELMENGLLVRRLIYGALLLALAPGCQVFRSGQTVSVLAVDAETKKPISGADVRISYPLTPAYRAPAESSGKTGED